MYKEVKKVKTKTVKEIKYKPDFDDDDDDDDDEYEVPEGIDIVLLDVPLMVKLLEYARSTATDVDLTNLATKLITKSNKWKSWKPLTETDYDMIIGTPETPTV